MVGRTNEHDVEVLLFQHLAIIVVGARLLFGFLTLAGDLDGLGEHVFVRIADGNDFHWRDLNEPPQVAFSIPARADESNTPGLFSGKGGRDVSGNGQSEESGGTCLEELATVHTLKVERKT